MTRRSKRRSHFTTAQRLQLIHQITETHHILMQVVATLDPRCEGYRTIVHLSDALLIAVIEIGGTEADWSAVKPGRMPGIES